jgi:hypothetical protein
MSTQPFVPCYIFPQELVQYSLPTPDVQPDIMNLVQLASTLIDEACGRIDGDGNGSLVYTTYIQRMLLQTRNRNLIQAPMKPLAVVPSGMVTTLMNMAATGASGNFYYTGVQANTSYAPVASSLTPLISASGRYGYTRQDSSIAYPDLFALINPLNLVTLFGGPAPWVSIDITNTDFNIQSGELWIPAGLQLQRYSEAWIIYNSGFNPLQMPWGIKMATACVVKNALVKGDGTTGLLSMSLGRSGASSTFMPMLLDPTVDQLLCPFRNVRAY